jgi:hypothetical protein
METMIIIILEILVLASIGSLYLFKDYLFSYSNSKGANLATKEDIAEITAKIENVKLEYAQQLESTRAGLSSMINNSSFRYEKEYEILSEITQKLVILRNCACTFRPASDFVDPNKTEDETRVERLTAFHASRRELFLIVEQKRPFYSDEIYEAVRKVDRVAHLESIQYQYSDPFPENRTKDYWDVAEKNQKDIVECAEAALKTIRDRVVTWEAVIDAL